MLQCPLARLTRQSFRLQHQPGLSPAAFATRAQALATNVSAGSLATAREADEEGRLEALRGRASERRGG
jgi:hypothetical protein